MMTRESLIRIGINACIDQIGRQFVQKYASTSSSAYGDVRDGVFCFVGVNDQPENIWDTTEVILDSQDQFPYRASCIVKRNGDIEFKECVLPHNVKTTV